MKYKISKKKKTKYETNCPFAVFFSFPADFILLLIFTAHFLARPNASLLVLKDLQPSKSEKTNRPWLGIIKKMVGYPFSQRKNSWAAHVVRRATNTAQPSLYPSLAEQPKQTARAAGSQV